MLDIAETEILKIRSKIKDEVTIKELLNDATGIIEKKASNKDCIAGLSTGLIDLDRLSDGLHPSEFVVIAAMPSCGKTALAVNIAVKNALEHVPCGILSAEMKPVRLVVRSICSESRVNYKYVTAHDAPKMKMAVSRLSRSPLFIESASGMTIGQVQASARRMKQKNDIRILVVDYIQLIAGSGDNREQQVASVGRGLKAIADQLDICVIGLSQLNDDGKLRESRAIGQDADSVWMLSNQGEWKSDIQPVKLAVDKSRDGETGMVDLIFQKTFTRFESVSKVSDTDAP